MAKAKLEEGVTDHNDIVDAIHEAIHDHTPLWKSEIADIISGYGNKAASRQATRTELQERLIQLKRDLKEAYHPTPAKRTAEEIRNKTRQSQIKRDTAKIQAEIEKLKEKLANKDYAPLPKAKRTPPQYDKQTQQLQQELANAKREADLLMRKIAFKGSSPAAKAAHYFLGFHRLSILSGLPSLAHLTGAALWRLGFTPLEQVMGAIYHQVPGIRKYSEMAPIHGGGFQGGALAEGYKSGFSKQMLKDAWDKLTRGYSDLDALHKAPMYDPVPMLNLTGRVHDMLKTPEQRFAYAKALNTFNAQQRAQMARDGMSPDDIDTAMSDEAMQARGMALAWEEAERNKFQGANPIIDAYRRGIMALDNVKGPGALATKPVSFVAKFLFPIVRVPMNLANWTVDLAGGELKAWTAIRHAAGEQFEKMSPEDQQKTADYIMQKFKIGAVGKVLAVMFLLGHAALGGDYDQKRRKRAGEPGYGEVRAFGEDIGKEWFHSPEWQYGMALVTAWRVAQAEFERNHRLGRDSSGDKADAAATGVEHGGLAIINSIPFIESATDFYKALQTGHATSDYMGRQAASMIPAIVKNAAEHFDPESALKRHPQGFVQEIEASIPGLRERVPLQDTKHMTLDAKLDAYEKMTPDEREKSDIVNSIYKTASHSRTMTDEQRKRVEAIQ